MTYVIGDIHGRADRFHKILEKSCFSEHDYMYILGDVIDRNPDGISILQEVMNAGNMEMILGNHEHMMRKVVHPQQGEEELILHADVGLWYYNGGETTHKQFLALPETEQNRIADYLENLPLNIELRVSGKDFLLVHGSPESSYTPDDPEFSDVTMFAVWKRLDPYAENSFQSKTVICGHTPTVFFNNRIPMEVIINNNVVCMDCGCAFPAGRLACLCLETGEIVYSE